MKLETIKTDKHLLLIDTEAVSEKGDWTYCKILNIFSQTDEFTDLKYINQTDNVCKVIAAYPNVDGILEFETLPPNINDDIEKIAKYYTDKIKNQTDYKEELIHLEYAVKHGYNKAKSETPFSLEDYKEIAKICFGLYKCNDMSDDELEIEFERVLNANIELLTKPKKYKFVPKMSTERSEGFSVSNWRMPKPIIIDNKIQGIWVVNK